MEKFSVGMDIRKVVTAKNMNEFVGAVNWIKENSGPASNWNGTFSGFKGGEIRVKFDGEESLDMFSAVALTDLELTPENCDTFKFETPTFNAEPFAEDSDLPFAILLEPANPGEIAKAVMIGITPAKVTIQDAAHGFAKPTADGDGALESCETGTAKILWKAGEEGEQWCILQLGTGAGGAGSSDFPFKITISGGGTTPPELHIHEGYVAVQKSENKHLFSSFPQFDFEALDDGRYLISGWIRRIPSGDSCGFFVSPEGTQFPTGPGFYVFPIGLIDKYIPEPDPEADPEEEQEEEYCRVALIEQYAWGNFTIPDRYYGLPFVPNLNVTWGNSVYVTRESFSVSAMIINAPSDLPNGLEDRGVNIQRGQQFFAYIEEPAEDIPRIAWRSSSSNDIETKTLAASIKYENDGSFVMNLYHLATYQKLLVRVNVQSQYETILIGQRENNVNVEVNFKKFQSEDGTVNIEEKDGVLDFSVKKDQEDEYTVKVNKDDENPDFLAKKIVSPNETLEISESNDNKTLQMEVNYDKFESTDDSIIIEEEFGGGGLDITLNTDRFQSTDQTVLIDKSSGALDFSINHNKFISSDNSVQISKLQNGSIDFKTSGGGGGSAEYNGMWKVSIDESNKFCVNPFSGRNNIYANGTLAKSVTTKLEINSTAAANTTKYIYMEYQVASSQCVFHVETVPIDWSQYDNMILLAVWTANTLIQVQYGPIKIVNNTYSGQWAVQLDGNRFKVPASSFGNLILTEDRVFYAVTDDLQSSGTVTDTGVSWCYLHVDLQSGISLEVYKAPIEHLMSYADYSDDRIPLAVYSPETGLVQLQYGPVRLNRYWVYDDGSGSGGGGEEEA